MSEDQEIVKDRKRSGACTDSSFNRPSTDSLSLKAIIREYNSGDDVIKVLDHADFALGRGEIVGLIGPSGSGKSSLLHAAGLLEKPNAGQIWINGKDCLQLSDNERTATRRNHIGFVYQFHQLLPEFNALENVVIPQLIAKKSNDDAQENARRLLGDLGLSHRLTHLPAQLSGGEQQRVAIARAVANQPDFLLADEPTGNLDPNTSQKVMESLIEMVRNQGLSALIATHNYEIKKYMDRVVTVSGGKISPYS